MNSWSVEVMRVTSGRDSGECIAEAQERQGDGSIGRLPSLAVAAVVEPLTVKRIYATRSSSNRPHTSQVFFLDVTALAAWVRYGIRLKVVQTKWHERGITTFWLAHRQEEARKVWPYVGGCGIHTTWRIWVMMIVEFMIFTDQQGMR